MVEQRTRNQITGEPMKFPTLADWTGMAETELFAQTNKSSWLATVRYPVLEVTAAVEPFVNARGFSLRVLRQGSRGRRQGAPMPRLKHRAASKWRVRIISFATRAIRK